MDRRHHCLFEIESSWTLARLVNENERLLEVEAHMQADAEDMNIDWNSRITAQRGQLDLQISSCLM